MRWLAGLVLAAVVVVSGCSGSTATATPVASLSATDAPVDSVGPSEPVVVVPTSPVAGIVVAVDSAGLDQVKGFTLRTNDGSTVAFTVGTLENGDEFPPGHLKEHQATGAPVLVFFRSENGALVVYRIEDAG